MSSPQVTFVTWLWDGWRPGAYNFQHVNRLYAQMKQHMSGNWRLVCVTDNPLFIECETYPLWPMPEPMIPEDLGKIRPNCYARLRLFDPDFAPELGDLRVSIDLDVTVYKDLMALVSPVPFKIARNELFFTSRYCGTLWQLRRGAHPEVWRQYDPVLTPHITYEDLGLYGSDQAWLSHMIPDAPTWGPADGVFWNKRVRPDRVPPGARLVYFAGNIKPWDQNCQLKMPGLYTPLL